MPRRLMSRAACSSAIGADEARPAPLAIARPRRNGAANLGVEAHEADGVTLPEKKQCERGGELFGIGELREPHGRRLFGPAELVQLRTAPRH